jgi:transcriptional regulator of acetoin/glycerol metabolism
MGPMAASEGAGTPTGPESPRRRTLQLRRAWEEFLTSGTLLPVVRPMVAASWRRSRANGISPTLQSRPVERGYERLLRSQYRQLLRRAGEQVVRRLEELAGDAPVTFTLADADGLILVQRGHAGMLRAGERRGIVPGARWSEWEAGTNGMGTALATGSQVQIFAAEHYCEGFHALTCTARPVRHPLTSQVVGVFELTCDYRQPGHHLWALTAQAAAGIEGEIKDLLLASDRVLLEALMSARQGVAAYAVDLAGQRTISNRGAVAAVTPADHALLWELIRRSLAERAEGPVPVRLANGLGVLVDVRPLTLEDRPVGALVVLTEHRRSASARPEPAREAWAPFDPGAPWLRPVLSAVPTLVVGETGTGKTTLVRLLHRNRGRGLPLVVLDGAGAFDERHWLEAGRDAQDGWLLLERISELSPERQRRLVALLDRVDELGGVGRPGKASALGGSARCPIVATATAASVEALRGVLRPDLLERLSARVVRIPPLRERPDDVVSIARALLRRQSDWHRAQPDPLDPAASAALRAYDWPGNVRQLEHVLARSVAERPRSPVDLRSLPPEVVLAGRLGRRGRLRQVEESTILRALQVSGGNVGEAARVLGVSRATVYRRLALYRRAPGPGAG